MKFINLILNIFVLLISSFLYICDCKAKTIEVPAGNSIQLAIDLAEDGDLIQLAIGSYPEDIDFKGKSITITGFGRDTFILGLGDNPVVSFTSGENNSAILDYLTVRGGNQSGGILVRDSSPTIRRCFIERNRSINNASAIFIDGELNTGDLFSGSVSAQIHNNIIAFNRQNKKKRRKPPVMNVQNASPNNFNNNFVRNDNDAILVSASSAPIIKNNIFFHNGSSRRSLGYGIHLNSVPGSENLVIAYNLFNRNQEGALLYENFGSDSSSFANGETEAMEAFLNDNYSSSDSLFIGNISGDPRFVRVNEAENLRLKDKSPARNAGDPEEFNENSSRINMGANGGEFGIYRILND